MDKMKIIACDFDGTLATNAWPDIGEPIFETIIRLKQEQENGARIILWTNRVGIPLQNAIDWCTNHNIQFDAINENLPNIIESFGGDPRKIFANEYWDDRMVFLSHLKHPDK